ncbi:cytochrome c-type biogenesis protein [Bowmanella pacifica]|uniref:Cytochrome c-type biogenesis protein n=1 Tax=Bowmanella pacifica TaxID=502051 RepID=A0A917YUZ4_9ALTE|nr:cytochrome c-type biogenesis protein [Bowmanella pacifica]GGO67415.1 cystathionine gamma-synthase [Bowmanella pacifica]
MIRLLWVMTLLLPLYASAFEEVYGFNNEQQRQLFKELTEELRCPKCQNQNIADSDALVAQDLKRKVYQLVLEGKDKTQVIDYMRVRYGDFVYYQPPINFATLFLWLVPVVFIIGSVGMVVWRRRNAATELDTALIAKAEKLLNNDKTQENNP